MRPHTGLTIRAVVYKDESATDLLLDGENALDERVLNIQLVGRHCAVTAVVGLKHHHSEQGLKARGWQACERMGAKNVGEIAQRWQIITHWHLRIESNQTIWAYRTQRPWQSFH